LLISPSGEISWLKSEFSEIETVFVVQATLYLPISGSTTQASTLQSVLADYLNMESSQVTVESINGTSVVGKRRLSASAIGVPVGTKLFFNNAYDASDGLILLGTVATSGSSSFLIMLKSQNLLDPSAIQVISMSGSVINSGGLDVTPAPRLKNVRLNDLELSMTVTFDRTSFIGKTSLSKSSDCMQPQYFTSETYSMLGKEPKCIWDSDSTLRVIFGSDFNVTAGSVVTIKPGVISSTETSSLFSFDSALVEDRFPAPELLDIRFSESADAIVVRFTGDYNSMMIGGLSNLGSCSYIFTVDTVVSLGDFSSENWVYCSQENEWCTCNGFVRYGKDDKYVEGPSNGKVKCDNFMFGSFNDPAYKAIKFSNPVTVTATLGILNADG
jgi:hypothetical protein